MGLALGRGIRRVGAQDARCLPRRLFQKDRPRDRPRRSAWAVSGGGLIVQACSSLAASLPRGGGPYKRDEGLPQRGQVVRLEDLLVRGSAARLVALRARRKRVSGADRLIGRARGSRSWVLLIVGPKPLRGARRTLGSRKVEPRNRRGSPARLWGGRVASVWSRLHDVDLLSIARYADVILDHKAFDEVAPVPSRLLCFF